MSEPTFRAIQDDELPAPRLRVRLLLALLRVLAGYRGHSSVAWTAGGFRYTVQAVRTPDDDPPVIDYDPDAVDAAIARARLEDELDL